MRLFFNYSLDCETPTNTDYTGPERMSFFGGPASWEAAEQSVRGFAEQMDAIGARTGASLFVYPDVAAHQRTLFREMAAAGIEIALHLNGLRYSRLRGDRAKWLGAMTREEQHEALRMAKADIEDAVGQACLGYRACYGSASDDTFPILEELGFTWASNACGKYRPEFHAKWPGSWRYGHHANARSKLVPGSLRLYEIPLTCGLTTFYDGNTDQPLDLRVETSPQMLGADREQLRAVIEENLAEMARRELPLRTIIGGSHNTNPFNRPETHQALNLDWVVRHTRELAAGQALDFSPSSFDAIRAEAERLDVF